MTTLLYFWISSDKFFPSKWCQSKPLYNIIESYNISFSIDTYLSKRKHRTKVNNSYSSWSEVKTGIPQGSILGPLLFNIYLNDTFLFIGKNDITKYADDNTPYATECDIDELLTTLKKDIDILLKWFHDNYDKCHLLVSNHGQDISLMIG